jgi:hypothetical protein
MQESWRWGRGSSTGKMHVFRYWLGNSDLEKYMQGSHNSGTALYINSPATADALGSWITFEIPKY